MASPLSTRSDVFEASRAPWWIDGREAGGGGTTKTAVDDESRTMMCHDAHQTEAPLTHIYLCCLQRPYVSLPTIGIDSNQMFREVE